MDEAATALARPDYALTDSLWAERGTVFLTGTQALLRVLLMQRQRDAAAGLDTQGFSAATAGRRWARSTSRCGRPAQRFTQAGIRFLPAVNEELAATAVLGTQRVESDPERSCDGVFALWYGKGPGVDRAGDALKHGNAYGSSPHGGVLVVAGDDHGCVSSSMPHQSDAVFAGLGRAGAGAGIGVGPGRVRALRLCAVALQRRLGRPGVAVGGGRKRRHRRPGPDPRARRRLGRRRHRAAAPPATSRRPTAALPLARPAQPAHRVARRRQAGRGGRLRARQPHRPRRHRRARRRGRHPHRRQGAPRPDGGAAPPGADAAAAGRRRRARAQAGAGVPGRQHRHARLHAGPGRGAGDRGKGRPRGRADARAVLQRRPAPAHRGQARRAGAAACQCAGRAAPVAADRDRGRLAGAARHHAGPPRARARLHRARAAEPTPPMR
jgi:hypothetical protein